MPASCALASTPPSVPWWVASRGPTRAAPSPSCMLWRLEPCGWRAHTLWNPPAAVATPVRQLRRQARAARPRGVRWHVQ
eukprot:1835789-Prymnesium_polylepis.1